MRRVLFWASLLLVGLLSACQAQKKSPVGFTLPQGDADAGREKFSAFKCDSCHTLAGAPAETEPVASPEVPLELGSWETTRTTGWLVTAVIHPSADIAPEVEEGTIQSGNLSRMGDFADSMRVRDLIDLVAFLERVYWTEPRIRRDKLAKGFKFPDGDSSAGLSAFFELKCHTCHDVFGLGVERPDLEEVRPVPLGGTVPREGLLPSDGQLFTAIVNPSHLNEPGLPPAEVQSGSLSRMGDFADSMTVRQLIDIIAFLHARSSVAIPDMPP